MKIELINEILEGIGLEEIKLQDNERTLIKLSNKKGNYTLNCSKHRQDDYIMKKCN